MRRILTALLALAALCAGGCMRVETSLPESLPEKKYATARAVTATIPREQALSKLEAVLARSRMPNGMRLKAKLAPDRLQWAWKLVLPLGNVERHEFDFAYAEVAPKIVDLSSLGGRIGVKFQKGGADVPYAYLATTSEEDAETILDCFAVLSRPGA